MLIAQDLIKGAKYHTKLEWHSFDNAHDFSRSFRKELGGARSSPIGLAILLPKNGILEGVALCVGQAVFVLRTKSSKSSKSRPAADIAQVFSSSDFQLVGFGMARMALHIQQSLGYHVKGYEIFDSIPPKDKVETPGQAVAQYVSQSSKSFQIDKLWDIIASKATTEALESLCLRAWITAVTSKHRENCFTSCVPVDTSRLKDSHLCHIFRMLKEAHQMEAAKPRINDNDFSKVMLSGEGHLVLHNERFKTRIRNSRKTTVQFTLEDKSVYHGSVKGVKGKKTSIKSTVKNIAVQKVKKVCVIGREELTHSEKAREKFILHLLQGKEAMDTPDSPFISQVWLRISNEGSVARVSDAKLRPAQKDYTLNQSQSNVIEAMVNSQAPIVVVHGPPGTGKTSTISVAVREWLALQDGQTTWAVAQSNVGVKNIAESLMKHNVPFKLLVSKEFHFEWHEEIYNKLESQLIRTDELTKSLPRDLQIKFNNIHVILCTLGTLSNPSLQEKGLFNLIPVKNLVIDEASQIGILEYLHIFAMFKKLKKVCFFGDPEQLPPYGKDAAPTLQSIFELNHLKNQAYFLDTQYRMPTPLGSFISKSVYNSILKSSHKVSSSSCVKMVDVSNGKEEKHGSSWKNTKEVQIVTTLVRLYFNRKDYCIITPYDAQRNAITKALKSENLRCDNVFNVDSFQGNEADYVIVSVVRTNKPGFLKSKKRVNVMLTRCKKGMIVVTKRTFAEGQARSTLLGELVTHWESVHKNAQTWTDWNEVLNGKANILEQQTLETKLASLTISSPHVFDR